MGQVEGIVQWLQKVAAEGPSVNADASLWFAAGLLLMIGRMAWLAVAFQVGHAK